MYLSKAQDFADRISSEGLTKALEQNVASIFSRDTVEAVWQVGGIASILSGNTKFITLDGIPLKEVTINKGNVLYFDTKNDALIGRQIGNKLEWGQFFLGEDGALFLKDGRVTVDMETAQIHFSVRNGELMGASTDLKANDVSLVVSSANGSPVEFYADGPLKGVLKNGVIQNAATGIKVVVEKGFVSQFFMPNPDGSGADVNLLQKVALTNLKPGQLFGAIRYAVANGIANVQTTGNLPDKMKNFFDGLAADPNINPQEVIAVPLYENGNMAKDAFSWVMDFFGANLITNQVIQKMDAEILARGGIPSEGLTVVAYSGSFQPLLKAIGERGYKVSTIVAVGGPTLMDKSIPKQVQRIVYVNGDRDTIPLVNKLFSTENRHPDFEHSGGSKVETINVRLINSATDPATGKSIGVNHGQYFVGSKLPTDPRELATYSYALATNQFLEQLTRFSQSGSNPIDLLELRGAKKIGDTYVVDVKDLL